MRNMIQRVDTLARHAHEKGVRLMIDAEQSYFQPAIRRLTMELMRQFNKDGAVIFNTYQCYMRDSHEQLLVDLNAAESEDFYFGAKLVRGAYVSQERERAAQLGYPDPVNPSFEATTEMFDKCFEECLKATRRRPLGRVSAMVATHNEDTVRSVIEKLDEYRIRPEHKVVCFGQLLGMCDQVSFALGNAGYSVYKYVPYGPVDEVLPYLSRRASENQAILEKLDIEKSLRLAELKRRLMKFELFHKP